MPSPVRVLAALLAVPVLVALAWAASNLGDADPKPVPPELSLPLPLAGSPMFQHMQGLLAPPGADAQQAGREAWVAMHQGGTPAEPGPRLPGIRGLPLACGPGDDCVVVLAGDVAALARQLEAHTLLGQRCEALMADPVYAEGLPATLTLDTPLPAYGGLVQCGHWFRGRAIVAAAAGDQAAALRQLGHHATLGRQVLAGSQTLIGHMIGVALLRNAFDGAAVVLQRQPGWAPALMPLVAAFEPVWLDSRRWIVTEAAFARGALTGMGSRCRPEALMVDASVDVRWLGAACALGIGYLPEATRQRIDGLWLRRWQEAAAGLDALVDTSLARRQAASTGATAAEPSGWAWRNTVGEQLAARADPELASYVLRLADLELHRLTLALALQASAERVPVAERAAWLSRQPLPARQAGRLSWSDDAARLGARPWAAELSAEEARRRPIGLPVPVPAGR